MTKRAYVAFDLGAESGRAMLAILENETITLQECHRFANTPQQLPSGYHWNLLDIWRNLVEGLKQAGIAAKASDAELVSLGVDTWGVDFGMLGKSGQLLGLPFSYRDDRNPPAMAAIQDQVGADEIYMQTGIQHMPFNSLYQLKAQQTAEPCVLENATDMLFMPDLLHYFFSGEKVNEATIASTSQMVNPHTGQWNTDLLEKAGLPQNFLEKIVPAGTKIGKLRDIIAKEAGIDPIDVVVPGSHDTASAIASVPVDKANSPNWLYLSSGTWSLMGAELDKPVVNEASLKANYTNERGVEDKIRFLKNISGLWLVQECRRDLIRQGQDLDYTTLTQMAADSEPFVTLIDTNHQPFAAPGDMLAKIDAFAQATGQPKPTSPGAYVRACLESLALTYRGVYQDMERLTKQSIEVLHIVGGGGQNGLLNQMTADAINKTVIVGPFEATAIGNALTQAIGCGDVKDLDHLRKIVRNSVDLETYQPTGAAAFDTHAQRYQDLQAVTV
ncbi:MAG: rhamnulokinase [Phycisphaeraceae bacterium]|nr:rhamnulokinase [Phycisphaeraceae bacterium]